MLTCVLGEVSCERSLAFVFLSKNKSVIPGEVFDPPRDSSFAKEVFFRSTPSLLSCLFRSTPSLLSQGGVFCPTCPSPAGGSLIPNQAFPLTIKGKDVTALQCCLFRSTPFLLSQGGLHRFPQAPFPSGDRGCNRPPVLRTASL